ncbi:MAG TPA: ricin-type beta-trefoil lectin domain protein [Candidatus Saccharimonadales bacterium]|nr:ricin-type beta-trefoil lectin domain protein [Candidatus Saccharimonadales bacterium]
MATKTKRKNTATRKRSTSRVSSTKSTWAKLKPTARAIFISLCTALILASAFYSYSYAQAPPLFTPAQFNAAFDGTIHSDVTESVQLPNKNILWIFGDTNMIDGQPAGFPHDAFLTQKPNSLTLTAVPGPYGHGWQQVPNWSDGTVFWMNIPVVDGNTLYIMGERVNESSSGFKVIAPYMAEFNASTLAYEGVMAMPGGSTGATVWGGVARTNNGFWVTGTHQVSCYIVNCKVGDVAFVPFGDLARNNMWQIYNNVIPATANVGTTLGLIQTSTGWALFTKQGDAYGGSSVERLSATNVTGTWTVNGTWPISSPSGSTTYGVAVHPEQVAPNGDVLVSYNVNGTSSTTYPYAQFLDLPVEQTGPVTLVQTQAGTSTNGNKCLDDYHSSTRNGNKIDIWTCNQTNAQQWTFNYSTSETLTAMGKCLDDTRGQATDGNKIQLWSCNGSKNQQWGETPSGEIVSVAAQKCLDDLNDGSSNGQQLVIEACSGRPGQDWLAP